MTATGPLEGLTAVVTRPAAQAAGLAAGLVDRGAEVIALPLLEVAPPRDEAPAAALVDDLAGYALAIFISANAAHRGLDLVGRRGQGLDGVEVAAVGKATARALREAGVTPTIVPAERYNSEGLLELLPAERVGGQRILIFRGEGGRALLAEELRARGAHVDYAEVYRRVMPDGDPAALFECCDGGRPTVVVLTSREAMDNLVTLTGDGLARCLATARLLVVNQDMVARAGELGFRLPPLVAARPDDDSLMATLEHWWTDEHAS